jgi:serine/threonine-protein kinase
MQTQTQKIRYQALGPLMSGEGSRAFLGLEISDTSPARPVVMVWVPGDTARDAEKRAQILRETQRAVTLEHPNITRVYGLASLDEGLARVVEFADGESLRRVMEVAHRLPPHFGALVAADAATGVHFAHVAGNDDGSPLVHGDLRPETLMVTYGGVCKVAGYGALSVAPRETDGKRVKRRRLYCAPEQIIGGRGAISVQTDVYLLGLILYECLTGRIPYDGDEKFEESVLQKPLPMENATEIPPALVPILVNATAKRASERFPTALAFRDAVEKAMGGLPRHEEFSGYLQAFFPEEDPARVARRQTIDAGIADHARREWERKGEEREAASHVSKPPAPAAPAAPTPTNRPRPTPLQVAAFKPKRNNQAAWLAGLLIVLTVGLYVGSQIGKPAAVTPAPAAPVAVATPPAPSPAAPTTPTRAAEPSEPAAPNATGASATEPAGPDKTPKDALAAVTPAAAHEPGDVQPAVANKPPAPSQLDLTVNPPVTVSLNGKTLGRTPLTVNLPPGRHQLRFSDSQLGINLTRPITVNRGGVTRHFMELGKGLLTVHIPDGAVLNLDGKVIGNQSVRDLSVWEGNHRLLVTMGTAKWQQAFTLGKDQTMEYEVQSEPGH